MGQSQGTARAAKNMASGSKSGSAQAASKQHPQRNKTAQSSVSKAMQSLSSKQKKRLGKFAHKQLKVQNGKKGRHDLRRILGHRIVGARLLSISNGAQATQVGTPNLSHSYVAANA